MSVEQQGKAVKRTRSSALVSGESGKTTVPASGISYKSKKGALLGQGSGITTAKQARAVVAALHSKRDLLG